MHKLWVNLTHKLQPYTCSLWISYNVLTWVVLCGTLYNHKAILEVHLRQWSGVVHAKHPCTNANVPYTIVWEIMFVTFRDIFAISILSQCRNIQDTKLPTRSRHRYSFIRWCQHCKSCFHFLTCRTVDSLQCSHHGLRIREMTFT